LSGQIFRIGKGDSARCKLPGGGQQGGKLAKISENIDQTSPLTRILCALNGWASDARWQHFESFSGIAAAQEGLSLQTRRMTDDDLEAFGQR
jgi:hypothetical protein